MKHKIEKFVWDTGQISMMDNSGVYRMWHIEEPEKFYIGSTFAKKRRQGWKGGFYTRWNLHITTLRSGTNSNPNIARLAIKYGVEGFRFQILAICPPEQCRALEFEFIKRTNPELNQFKGTIPVFQFDLNGRLLNRFEGMQEASKDTKCDRSSINNCLLGNRISAGGFLWSLNDVVIMPELRMIQKLTMTGEHITTFETLAEAQRSLNLTSSNAIRNALTGIQKQAYGFKWKYVYQAKGYSLSRLANEPHQI